MQEIRADRAVAVFEAREHDAVLHLHHFRAGEDRERVGGGAAPRRIPGAAHAFSHRARLEDVRGATGAYDHRFCAKHIEIASAHIEADGAGYAVGAARIHQQMRDHDAVVDLGCGLAGSFRDDGLVALAVDHDLPLAFALIPPGGGIAHDRQTPFFELVYGGIDVAGNVVAEIFA